MILDSINKAKQAGISDDQILSEIIKQNPDKKAQFEQAKQRGASASQILSEITRQNQPAAKQPGFFSRLAENLGPKGLMDFPATGIPARAIGRAYEGFTSGLQSAKETQQDITKRQQAGEISAGGAFVRNLGQAVQQFTLPVTRAAGEVVRPITEPVIGGALNLSTAALDIATSPLQPLFKQAIGTDNIKEIQSKIDNLDEGTKQDLVNAGRTLESVLSVVGGAQAAGLARAGIGAVKSGAAGAALKQGAAKVGTAIQELGPVKGIKAAQEAEKTLAPLFQKEIVAQTESAIDDLTLKITQGNRQTVKQAKEALKQFDMETIKNIKTANDLAEAASAKGRAIQTKKKSYLEQSDELFKPQDTVLTETAGKISAKTNYVDRALVQLKALYDDLGENLNSKRIEELTNKYKNEGLTLNEMDDLAIEYNRDFGGKAFSLVKGEPKPNTKIGLNQYENTRKGIKETVRSKIQGEVPKELDLEQHNLITLEKDAKIFAQSVDNLAKKIEDRNLWEKVANKIGAVVEKVPVVSGGLDFSRSLLQKLFQYSNVGRKVPNSIGIQNMLNKRLIQFKQMTKLPEEKLINRLVKAVKEGGGEKVFTQENIITPKLQIRDNIEAKRLKKNEIVSNIEAKKQSKALTNNQDSNIIRGTVNKTNVEGISQNLIEEARKYKSAEEFVKAQGTLVLNNSVKNNGKITSGIIKLNDGELRFSISDMDDNIMIIDNVNVKTQKKGTGTKLMEEAEKIASENGYEKIELGAYPQDNTIDSESLKNFYENLGYDVIEKSDFDGVDYYEMAKNIFSGEKATFKTKSQLTDIWKKANQKK